MNHASKLKSVLFGFAVSAMLSSASVIAADVDHFKGAEAKDLNTALCNLKAFDEKLQLIANKSKLKLEDLAEVHQLTYTLEVALQKIQADINQAAIDLETVHKSSERAEFDNVKQASEAYLKTTKQLTSSLVCKG